MRLDSVEGPSLNKNNFYKKTLHYKSIHKVSKTTINKYKYNFLKLPLNITDIEAMHYHFFSSLKTFLTEKILKKVHK